MLRSGGESWQMRCNVPDELRFCGVVGQQEGFSLADERSPGIPAEAAWRDWWERLLARGFDWHMEQVRREMPDRTPQERIAQLREAGARFRVEFDPPAFPELAHVPGLQRLCQRHWPHFRETWGIAGGEKWELTQRLTEQMRRVRLAPIVRACAAAAGRSAPAPFVLRVDFVGWPRDYRRTYSEGHLVLGADYLDEARTDELAAVLRQAISRLV